MKKTCIYIATAIAICFLFFMVNGRNSVHSRAIGIWTDSHDIIALELRKDGTLSYQFRNESRKEVMIHGYWEIQEDGRLMFDLFDRHSLGEQDSLAKSLYMTIAFEGEEMIHTPEQGLNKGKAIHLRKKH